MQRNYWPLPWQLVVEQRHQVQQHQMHLHLLVFWRSLLQLLQPCSQLGLRQLAMIRLHLALPAQQMQRDSAVFSQASRPHRQASQLVLHLQLLPRLQARVQRLALAQCHSL